MKKLAENDLTYFYHRHVVIVVTAVTTINLTPVIYCRVSLEFMVMDDRTRNQIISYNGKEPGRIL
jgi:hypothetical protein